MWHLSRTRDTWSFVSRWSQTSYETLSKGLRSFWHCTTTTTLSKNNRGRWAAERKTHVLELKECVHSILAIPTSKLYTQGSLYRVTVQSHMKAESPGGGDFDATHFSSYMSPGGVLLASLLTLKLWFWSIILIPLHLADIICWPQTPVLPALPAPYSMVLPFGSIRTAKLHASVFLRPSRRPVCSSSAQLRASSQLWTAPPSTL